MHEQVERLIKENKDSDQRAKMPNPLECLEPLLIDICNEEEKVRADRFSLMIAGESKSGKKN